MNPKWFLPRIVDFIRSVLLTDHEPSALEYPSPTVTQYYLIGAGLLTINHSARSHTQTWRKLPPHVPSSVRPPPDLSGTVRKFASQTDPLNQQQPAM